MPRGREGFLQDVGVHRQLRLAGVTVYNRRRRPAGEAALRRQPPSWARVWALAGGAVGLIWAAVLLWPAGGDILVDWDLGLSRSVADWENAVLVNIAEGLQWITAAAVTRSLFWGTMAVLAVFRRWRHLLVGLITVTATQWAVEQVAAGIGRPRPSGVDVTATLEAVSHPSVRVVGLAVVLVMMGYSLFPAGRWRLRWLWSTGAIVAGTGLARVYLGSNYLSGVAYGAIVGAAAGMLAFHALVPEAAFPVEYTRRRKAHVAMTAERAATIRVAFRQQMIDTSGPLMSRVREAVRDQLCCEMLNCEVVQVTPFRLQGASGSMPLRVTVHGDPPVDLFAKLYTETHLRSDRFYKLGRAILYGALEDERPYSSVRRLVEYEDYMLRVMHAAGIPSPQPFGVVELVRGREYLVITEFFDGAVEISEADVDENIVDDALRVIHQLWDAGIAHRDVKPSNVLVQEGRVRLVDVAFGEVRPSPWREAVDLANMMLVLALGVGPAAVYERALHVFSEHDIAEAFAATRGVTMPTQLRTLVRQHELETGIDLVAAFRSAAPARTSIAVQLWSPRRIVLAAMAAVGAVATGALVFENLRGVDLL